MAVPPLASADDADLARAVQENLYAFFRAQAALPGFEIEEGNRLGRHHAFPGDPMFKGAWRTRLPAEALDEAIDETVAWFRQRGAPWLYWWTGTGDEPPGLATRLRARGFAASIHGDGGMAANLDTLDPSAQPPDGFRFASVADEQSLADWREAFRAAFGVLPVSGEAWVEATRAAGLAEAPWQLFVGYLAGRPAATSLLFCGAGVAGLYGVGTVKEARRQGVGAAMSTQTLLAGRDQGYHYAVGFATEAGRPVYRRLGYWDLPCQVGRCLLWLE